MAGKTNRKVRAKTGGYYIPRKVWEPFAKRVGIGKVYEPAVVERLLEHITTAPPDKSIGVIMDELDPKRISSLTQLPVDRETWETFAARLNFTGRNAWLYLKTFIEAANAEWNASSQALNIRLQGAIDAMDGTMSYDGIQENEEPQGDRKRRLIRKGNGLVKGWDAIEAKQKDIAKALDAIPWRKREVVVDMVAAALGLEVKRHADEVAKTLDDIADKLNGKPAGEAAVAA